MRVKLIKSYRDAFGDAYNVFTKVKRDKPEYYPWERVLTSSFKVLKLDHAKTGKWSVWSMTEGADKYMKERFGSDEHRYFKSDVELRKFLMQLIPDWIGKDYSGGMVREFEFID